MKNIKEFEDLIKRYESITETEIRKVHELIKDRYKNSTYFCPELANNLTGFGSSKTCTLCKPLDLKRYLNCHNCVWISKTTEECAQPENEKTYYGIQNSSDINELLLAFKNRAKYMKQVLNK